VSLQGLRIAAARYALGLITSEELHQAADNALDHGLYSYSLGELATISQPMMAEVGPLFEAVLRELSIPLLSKEDATDLLLKRYIRLIVEETTPPHQGLDHIFDLYDTTIVHEKVSQYVGDSRGIHHLLGAYYAYDDLRERPGEVSYEGKFGQDAIDALDRRVVELAIEWNQEYSRATIDPNWLAWNNGTVRRVARSIEEECTFNQLPTLADALEEAGCRNDDILTHCRRQGNHQRRCWVIDLIVAHDPLDAKSGR
jgi:hypothetical protein